ncbi:LysR family transcriptional regulator [Actinomycetes bacterium KLBMP 9759]
MELDLGAVRAFLAVAELRHFGAAADRLGLSQQAVSKRVAKLEDELGAALLLRTSAGAELTGDGTEFLPHARSVLAAADQAVGSLRDRRRALRVDVLGTRFAATELLHDFHVAVGGAEIDIIKSNGLRSAVPALLEGTIDAAYARVRGSVDPRIAFIPVHAETLHVIAGDTHPFAGRKTLDATELDGVTAWMPGNEQGSEWSDFYADLAERFGLRIETRGPNFGFDYLLEQLPSADGQISFIGEGTRMPWRPDIVRIPVVRPAPAYPWYLLWRRDTRHPLLTALVAHSRARFRRPGDEIWLPAADDVLMKSGFAS